MDYTLSGKPEFTPGPRFKLYSLVKRCFDLGLACFMMIFAAVPCALIAIAIKLTSRGPAVFRQERVGRNGAPFTCLKFRTMRQDAPHSEATCTLKDADSYITGVGKILRKFSLDELPQLINIIKGDMSFIGPRPLIPQEEYIHRERYKKGVYFLRPGISGLAQINGRDNLGADAKVAFDEKYLHRFSLIEDIAILVKTVLNVVSAKDVVEGENDKLK